eukprot:PhF_6_TR27826/c0_g1_i1/m.40592
MYRRSAIALVGTLLLVSFFIPSFFLGTDYFHDYGTGVEKTVVFTMSSTDDWGYPCHLSSVLRYTAPTRLVQGNPEIEDSSSLNCRTSSVTRKFHVFPPSARRKPQRSWREMPSRNVSMSTPCLVCDGEYHHGILSSIRRQFFLWQAEVNSAVTFNELHVTLNNDNILVSTAAAIYDYDKNMFVLQSPAQHHVMTMPLPSHVLVTAKVALWDVNISRGMLSFSSSTGEARSILRALFVLTGNDVVVQECDLPTGECSRMCPPLEYPYLPCPMRKVPSAKDKLTKPNKAKVSTVTQGDIHIPLLAIFAFHGFTRREYLSRSDFAQNVLRHSPKASVYVATWNKFQEEDAASEMKYGITAVSDVLKTVFGSTIRDIDLADLNQFSQYISKKQRMYVARKYFLISNVLSMISLAETEGDIIVLSPLGPTWRQQLHFHLYLTNMLVTVARDATSDTYDLEDASVVIGQEIGDMRGEAHSVLIGSRTGMIRIGNILKYCTENLIPAGESEVPSIYMNDMVLETFLAENGMHYRPVDIGVVYRDLGCEGSVFTRKTNNCK